MSIQEQTAVLLVSRHSTPVKIFNAILLGLLCLCCSQYDIALSIGDIAVDVPWSIIFPILAAMSYGPRYGFISAVTGGALFPFLLWGNNGWANVLNFLLLSLFYVSIGTVNGLSIERGKHALAIRLATILTLFGCLMSFCFLYLFNWFLHFNPPFWTATAVTSLDDTILHVFVVKDIINYTVLVVVSEILLCLPPVRKFFGLSIHPNMSANTKILLSTTLFSIILWGIFTILDLSLVGFTQKIRQDHFEVHLFMLVVGGLIAGRVIILFASTRFDVERELRESDERRRTILHAAMHGFWLTDAEGRLLEVNESYCRMSGYSEQELLRMRIPDFEAVESSHATYDHLQKVIARGEDWFETMHRRRDGSTFRVEISVQY